MDPTAEPGTALQSPRDSGKGKEMEKIVGQKLEVDVI